MVDESLRGESLEPLFTLIGFFLVESKVNGIGVCLILVSKLDHVLVNAGEVLLGLLRSGGSQTFVVLDFPAREISILGPLLVLGDREEGECLGTLASLDDGSHEFLHEAVHPEERGPEVIDKVNEQAFNV